MFFEKFVKFYKILTEKKKEMTKILCNLLEKKFAVQMKLEIKF